MTLNDWRELPELRMLGTVEAPTYQSPVATDNPASPVHYRLLSEHFQACVDLTGTEREAYLAGPTIRDASLREELRSLLQYHPSTSKIVAAPRVVKSTPTRGVRIWKSRSFLIPFLLLGTSMLLVTLLVRSWTLGRLEASYKAEGVRQLQQLLDSRISAIRSWAGQKKELARSALQDPAVVSNVSTLLDRLQTVEDTELALRSSPSYGLLAKRMSQLPEGLGACGFCLFNAAGMVLCSDAEGTVGHPLPMNVAACLRGVALGEWIVSRPFPDRQLGLNLQGSVSRPVMFAGGPISSSKGNAIAFGVFFFSPRDEFFNLLSPTGTAELMAFDERSLLLNDLQNPGQIRKLGLLPGPHDDQTALRIYLRDPGRELKGGSRLEASSDQWSPTRMCLSAILGLRGSDASGYRNFVGRPVVGTWAWLPEQEMGVGAEEQLEMVLAPLQPLRSGFLFLLSIPVVLTGALFFAFGRVRFRQHPDGETRFGFYTVERPIGQGGMADVFLATHSILNRSAALKILRDPRPNEATVARFKREARMASRLGHPNSIQIFDYGETSDGCLYYAMEYVEGLNLAQMLTLEGPLPVGRALYLLKQIAGALEEAHALGLLHRDLKPPNIMVGKKGGLGDVVKILDFGIASSVSGQPEDVTCSKNLIGTPAYIAPERIQHPDHLDFRSDIYSFGAVAFHMVTGRSIFEGPGPAELIYQVLTCKRPSPSQLRGEPLPEALEGLILGCLAIEPELRPSSMREITEELKRIEIQEPWSQDEARDWWVTHWERVVKFKCASC
jgi:tRNA A-37 threonylcarbamoyl transferase component Bud32